jgi:putative nucleotidyltransferase with HDIG domain
MTQETRRRLRFSAFAVSVALAATAAVWWAWTLQTRPVDYLFPLMLVAWVISEWLTVAIPGGGSISLSYPLAVATTLAIGPGYASAIAFVSNAPDLFARPRSSWDRLLFNSSQVVLSVAIPGIAFTLLHGTTPGAGSRLTILPLIVVATLGIAVNFGLSAMALNILSGETAGETARLVWARFFSWMSPSQLVLGFVGVAIAVIIRAIGGPGLALFVVPLIVARQTYQQSVRLREAYADTVSSMVAALEAKDLYTKGHSLRVADYAVRIARSMSLADDRVRRIEYAALLHDLGKVGVSRRVLGKEARLSSDEYDEIKRHPDIGAHILSDVPYLADLVPVIAAHHERLDGSGYGHGLSGDAIPFEARILSVADAYDAMTSVRPYRGAMSHAAAMDQLVRGAGTQFDAEIVEAFQKTWQETLASDEALSEGAPA